MIDQKIRDTDTKISSCKNFSYKKEDYVLCKHIFAKHNHS